MPKQKSQLEFERILRWEDDGGKNIQTAKAAKLSDSGLINQEYQVISKRNNMLDTPMITNKFALLATDVQIERTVRALEANNIHAIVAQDGAEAKRKLFEIIPANAEVFISSSTTLNTLGVTEEIDKSGRFNSVREKLGMMDPKTQNREMQKLGATPEYMLGSVHAVTETGRVIIASKTGSQLAGYVAAAAHVIWVVGTQKIVPTLEEGMKRVEEYVLPLESARAMKAYGVGSAINKLLIVNKEFAPGRTTLILIKEDLGF
jgi:L-lactate utilization protein LutC